ncbi:glycosyltransferase family 2 protein, partial [Acinetobacter ursingii]|uniref:glycosyltransferase family 2 protein n=1 Tax=Acinetobacter ursingii TaxID=108980 RepID=UPI0032B3BCBA
MMIVVSFIIPIYNVEKYIVECLTSIACQINNKIEIIFINDGTKDNSIKIVESYIRNLNLEQQQSFVILHQKNQGQSVARNNAITKAKGKYIGFIDSDDVIAENYFENILNIIENYYPDIIRFKYATFSSSLNESISQSIFLANEGITLLNNKILIDIFNDMAWFSVINIIRKSFFEQNKYPIGVYFEDVNLISKIFTQAKNIYFLNETLYFYRFHEDSSMRNTSSNNNLKLIYSHKAILKEMKDRLQKEKIYSSIFVAFNISYFNLLIKTKSYKKALKQHFLFRNYKNLISLNYLNNPLYIN